MPRNYKDKKLQAKSFPAMCIWCQTGPQKSRYSENKSDCSFVHMPIMNICKACACEKPKSSFYTFERFVVRNTLQLNLTQRNGHVEVITYKYLKSRSNRGLTSVAGVVSHLASKCQTFRIPHSASAFRIPHSTFRIRIPHTAFRIPHPHPHTAFHIHIPHSAFH